MDEKVLNGALTPELLEGGSFLKKAVEICKKNRTYRNMFSLLRILRDSWVWIPCSAVLSEEDYKRMEETIKAADAGEGLGSLVGQNLTMHDEVRLVPDILISGDLYFFPVFTSVDEMGEYGEHFSKIEKHFLEAVNLAKNNEKQVSGIVINAFSDPFIIDKELFDIIGKMESGMEKTES